MARKQTSARLSALAGRIVHHGYRPTEEELLSMAQSLIGQDESKGDQPLPTQPEEPLDLTEIAPPEITPKGEDQ